MTKRVKANTNWNPWKKEADLPENLKTTRTCLHARQSTYRTPEGTLRQKCLRCPWDIQVEGDRP